jgi:Protein of unknown function (DUF3530)
MWKRLSTLLMAALVCLPAASDAPTPSGATPAAAPLAATVERVGLLPTAARRANELEAVFPDDVIVRIGEGDDRAIGVYREAIQPKAIGVIVVVLGSGMSADSSADVAALRRALARRRWATLAVALPDIPNEILPLRQRNKFVEDAAAPATPAPAQAAAAAPPVDPMPARVRARLDAAAKAARSKASKVVMLGEGAVGAWIAWAKLQGLDTDALVVIDIARDTPRIDGKRPKDLLAGFKSPLLMLVESPLDWTVDDRLSPDVDLRRMAPGTPSGGRLDRQIEGWLKHRFDSRG